MNTPCIACGSPDTVRIGALPVYTPDFLGQPIDNSFDASSLYRCFVCTLRFRFPQPTAEQLLAYYAGLSETEWWQHGTARDVWRHIKKEVQDLPQMSVLDVGCFRGDLLTHLGEGFKRFGVEPSASAREEARSRGITLLGDSIDSLRDERRRFGAITMIDVIEHLPRPVDSLCLLTRLLLPGGKLIIFTGDTEALSWRIANLHYWYSALPEHVAFFRLSWFRWVEHKLNCTISSCKRLAYQPASFKVRLDESLKNLAFVTYHRVGKMPAANNLLSRVPLLRRIGQWQSCWWTSARDHLLVTLTKEDLER
jgi:2-polyprenyl-3-methyl-5-hydroxy-6-metoxy-1,4-benzoquinol methylase